MSIKYTLLALHFFGLFSVIVGLMFAGAAVAFQRNPFVFLILAAGGLFVMNYGTTRLVYTQPLSEIMRRVHSLQIDEGLLKKRVGR